MLSTGVTGAKKTVKPGKDVDVVLGAGVMDKVAELEARRKHQTRIFTHFVVPKKEGGLGVGIKGEIHPAIVRLGRQFADMKIVGANARCIATLVAFKTVCNHEFPSCVSIDCLVGDTRLHHPSKSHSRS